jgi:hypothetical protein
VFTLIIRSNLKTLADAKGVSIREIARSIDYRLESVRDLYHDKTERYPRDLIAKLCVYFNVTAAELLPLSDN